VKTVKPFRLSVLTRPYRWQRRDSLGVAVLALAELGDTPRLLPEQELWTLAGEEAGGVLDTGMPKPLPEVLASGHAYTCHQRDRTACAVRLKVGEIVDKALLVFGDRYWVDGRPDAARPFDAMRLDWTRAYGGPGVAENPLGMGAMEELVNGVRVRRVPNIEAPHERLSSPSQRPAPAGYGALAMDWPQRARHMGSRYDQDWLEHDYPGFAPDMDARLFQAAPRDQWASGPDARLAGADYEIHNMHPRHAVLRGRIPDWRARCFVSREADGTRLDEIQLALSTAWFFPHRDRVVLIWHGRTAIREDDAADIRFILPALETPQAPRDIAHYDAVMARRLDTRRGVLYALLDEELIPPELCAAGPDTGRRDEGARPSRRNLRAGAERRHAAARAELLEQGLDPDRYLAPPEPDEPAPSLSELPERIARLERELEAAKRGEGASAFAYADPELDGLAAVAGVDIAGLRGLRPDMPAPGLDAAEVRRQVRQARAQQRTARRADNEDHAARAGGDGAVAAAGDEHASSLVRAGYLNAAQHFAPPPPMAPHRARRTRERLRSRAGGSRDARNLPLAGADLSGMDLRGMDFRGANLAGANLADACLDGCDFSEAVLAVARFERTSAREARFVRANLGGARCAHSDFHAADLDEAIADEAVLEDCTLDGARLGGGRWFRTLLRSCDLSDARLAQWTAMNAVLEHCLFAGASIEMCAFMESTLQGCDFTSARLTRVAFTKCRFSGTTTFARAGMDSSAFAAGVDLPGACFAGARLRNSSLRGAVLDGADFSGAQLEACDLSECRLNAADLSRLRAPRSLFVRADMRDATLRDAYLLEANLSKAVLLQADLGGANLFRADVSQSHMDDSTRTQGAYTAGARRYPLRRAGGTP
jgi:uncharacterized protein YjbI with pentapeptide repeats